MFDIQVYPALAARIGEEHWNQWGVTLILKRIIKVSINHGWFLLWCGSGGIYFITLSSKGNRDIVFVHLQ